MTKVELVNLGRMVVNEPAQLGRALRERPAFMLLVSNVAAQAISVGFSPVLSRLYTPEQFGVLGALTALVMIGAPLVTARFEMAIPRATDERTAWLDLVLAFATIGTMTAVFAGVSFVATHTFAPATVYRDYWFFIPLGLAGIATYNTLGMEASRRGELQSLAASKLSQATLGVGTQLVLGAARTGSFGLLVGFLVNQSAGIVRLTRGLVLNHPARGAVRWAELLEEARRNRRFAIYSSWSATLDSASKWGLQLALSLAWNPVIGGYLFLADRIVGRPLNLLSTSLLPVFISDVSQALRRDRTLIWGAFKATLRVQLLATAAWTSCVLLTANWVIVPLFGPEWADSVTYIQLMTLGIAPTAVGHAVSHTLQLAGKQRLEALLASSKAVAVLIAIGGGWLTGASAPATLAMFAAVQATFAILVLALSARAAREMSR